MNVVITGASKGIGYELVKLFAKINTNKIVAIARSKDLLNNLKKECNSLNPDNKLYTLGFDIENPENVKNNLKNHISNYFDSVDILINNAGILINKSFQDFSIEEINKIYNINFISHTVLIQDLILYLKKSNKAHVVNISSMGAFQGSVKFPGLSIYSSSKAALANLTECLAEEYKDDQIKFNCLALGAVDTEMLNKAFPGYKAPVNPKEMAEYIYNFALNGNQFFNGKIIPVSISTP